MTAAGQTLKSVKFCEGAVTKIADRVLSPCRLVKRPLKRIAVHQEPLFSFHDSLGECNCSKPSASCRDPAQSLRPAPARGEFSYCYMTALHHQIHTGHAGFTSSTVPHVSLENCADPSRSRCSPEGWLLGDQNVGHARSRTCQLFWLGRLQQRPKSAKASDASGVSLLSKSLTGCGTKC